MARARSAESPVSSGEGASMAGGMTGSKEAARSAEPRVVDGNVPRHAPMEPPDQGVGPGSRPLPQLVGDLTMSVWGLAALASADETGLLDELGEPGSAQALAQRTGLPAPLVESLMDVLVALGLVRREGRGFVAGPTPTPPPSGPGGGAPRAAVRSDPPPNAPPGARAGASRPPP